MGIVRSEFNEYKDLVLGAIFGLLCVSWFYLIVTVIGEIEFEDPISTIRVLTLIGGSAGIAVAIWKIFHDQNWKRSEAYLSEAKELLEKAYSALYLFESGEYSEFPTNNRYAWLSSVRLLLASDDLATKINDPSHVTIYEENKEYWRIQFREKILKNGEWPKDQFYYYQEGALTVQVQGDRDPIAEQSLYVLFKFMQWPDSKEDRLSRDAKFTDDDIEGLIFGAEGLRDYLNAIRSVGTANK